jgi:hypothetical protein
MAISKMAKAAIRTVCAVLAVAALAPATAAADVEPNNSVFDFEGPILGGQDIVGTLSSGDQNDWYALYADGIQQLHLTSSKVPPCAAIRLTDTDGREVGPDYTSGPGTTRFFVHVNYFFTPSCPAEASYGFRVDPAGALAPGPAKLPVRGTREPNETLVDAGGPLLPGAWYSSTVETNNDHDWLHFYVRPGAGRIDVESVVFGRESCNVRYLHLTNSRGRRLSPTLPFAGVIEHRTVNVERGAKLFVHSYGLGQCVGSSAVVKVGPDEAIMSRAEVRATCSKGRRGERRGVRQVAADKRAIARAGGSPSRGQRRKLAGDRRKLKSARRLVRIYC